MDQFTGTRSPDLTPGAMELLIDGLTDDVPFVWVLIHFGIRANPSTEPGPPSTNDVELAFSLLKTMTQRGLIKVGRLKYVDGGLPGRFAPVKHFEDPLEEAKRSVLSACEFGSNWEWSCWVVTTPSGDDLARQALAEE